MTRSTRRSFIIFSIAGLVFLAWGIATFGEPTWTATHKEPAIEYTWNFSFSLGIMLLLLAAMMGWGMLTNKSSFFSNLRANAERYKSEFPEIVIHIDDQGVSYQTPLSRHDIKWPLFTQYAFLQDHLILPIGNNYEMAIIISKNDMNENDFTELMGFVKQRLRFAK